MFNVNDFMVLWEAAGRPPRRRSRAKRGRGGPASNPDYPPESGLEAGPPPPRCARLRRRGGRPAASQRTIKSFTLVLAQLKTTTKQRGPCWALTFSLANGAAKIKWGCKIPQDEYLGIPYSLSENCSGMLNTLGNFTRGYRCHRSE